MISVNQYQPQNKLARYVRRISVFESNKEITYKQKITPSAYCILSYNHFEIPILKMGKDIISVEDRLQLVGPKTRDDIEVNYDGKLRQILFEFTAMGFYYLFRNTPGRIVNNLINIEKFSSYNTENLLQELQNSKDTDKQIELLESWLSELVSKTLPFCEYIEKAVEIFERVNGRINIAELSEQIFKSKRQFERRFKEIVGINPKEFSKIIQLHYILNLIQKKEYKSVQDLSYQSGFFDASSFSNRFKELTGFSPTEFIESNEHLALKYFTDLL